MKRVFSLSVLFLVCIWVLGQNYSFSIAKTGIGEQNIIFIPGFACSGEVWNETVEELKTNYMCYVLTMAGFAGVVPEDNPSFENWKTEITSFIEQERIDDPIIIGHSMGGGLALAIASEFPTLVKKIIVVDALPCLMALANPNFKSVADNDCSGIINHIIAMDEEQFIQRQKASVATLTTSSLKFDEIVNWGLTSDRKTYAKLFCDFSNVDLRDTISQITIPVLVLLEPHFKNIEAAINEQYKNLATAQLKYAGKGLHFIMFDDKEWFMNEVKEFIKK